MAQNKYSFNGYIPNRQPIKVTPQLATTSTEESGRVQTGLMYNTTMFTVIAYDIEFGKIDGEDLAGILSAIVGKPSFAFHHFNVFKNRWETSQFYAANIDCSELKVKDGKEFVESLSFQVTAINPI